MVDEKVLQPAMIRWGVTIVGMLVVAGAVSLANRGVYTKAEVDQRDKHVMDEVRHVQQVQQLQNDHTNEQLGLIRSDMHELKDMIRESNQ